jgi:hypothetical protein
MNVEPAHPVAIKLTPETPVPCRVDLPGVPAEQTLDVITIPWDLEPDESGDHVFELPIATRNLRLVLAFDDDQLDRAFGPIEQRGSTFYPEPAGAEVVFRGPFTISLEIA